MTTKEAVERLKRMEDYKSFSASQRFVVDYQQRYERHAKNAEALRLAVAAMENNSN